MAATSTEFYMGYNVTGSDVITEPKKKVGIYIGMSIFTFFSAIFIFVVNMMIILAPVVYRPLRKKTFLFVSSLALADVMTALMQTAVRPMVLIKDFAPPWFVRTDLYCRCILFLLIFPQLSSIVNLFLIAIDRYIGICYPLQYKTAMSSRRCGLMLAVAWIFSFSVAALSFFWSRTYEGGRMACQISDMAPLHYHLFMALPGYIIIISMFLMYFRIYHTLNNNNRFKSDANFRKNNPNAAKTEKKVVNMLCITLGVFVICWMPMFIIMHFLVERKVQLFAIWVPYIISYLNSGVNFFIYAARSQKYKTAFKMMCACRSRKEEPVSSSAIQQLSSSGGTKSTGCSSEQSDPNTVKPV